MRKIQYLDGLRGLAAFVVVFHHFILAFLPAMFFEGSTAFHLAPGKEVFISGTPFNLFYGGNFAVCIFFVLSGYVLSHKFFLKKDPEIIIESAVKRYIRLVIPVAVSVFLAYALIELGLFYNVKAADVSGSSWLGSFWQFAPSFVGAMDQTFLGAFFTNFFHYNVTLWTISYEFAGSFLVFAFLAFFGTMRNRYLAYIFAIIFFFQTYYLAFVLGMMLSDLEANKKMLSMKFDKSKIFRAGLLMLGLFFASFPAGRSVDGTIYASLVKDYFNDSAVLYHILGAFLVMFVLLNSKRMQKFLSFKGFLFLGEISFSMYLLHFILMGSFGSFVFIKLAPHFSYVTTFLISFTLSVSLLFTIAYWMHIYIDKRAVDFSKMVYQRFFKVQ